MLSQKHRAVLTLSIYREAQFRQLRDNQSSSSKNLASVEGAIAEFEAPKIDRSHFKIQVSDRDVQPLVRIPPVIPPRAEKSGHCRMQYDVSPEGVPFNVTAIKCTDSVFENASVSTVKKWKFNPKIVNGRAVSRSGVENKVSFRLTDENGYTIPLTSVKETPVSTFSVDVDTASYSFFRSSINRGQLPPRSSIRLVPFVLRR